MILMNSALASILVLLGACDRASAETKPSRAVMGAEAGDDKPTMPAAKAAGGPSRVAAKTVYVCPMHPDVVSETPGLCPKCNMKLDPKTQGRGVEERVEAPNWP